MPVHVVAEDGGKILVVHVSGKVVAADYAPFVSEFERRIQQHGKLRVLFDMTGFHGRTPARCGRTPSSTSSNSAISERLATVREKKWQRGMAMFSSTRKRPLDTSVTPKPSRRGRG